MTSPSAAPDTPVTPERRLQQLTAQARAVILSRQDPNTGLLPASTAITVHGDYTHAWVRDNVYSILAIWALELAHRERHPATSSELQLRVVALMRGLLAAMMKQAHKVERFKHTQHPLDALHAKYATHTGDWVVGDAEWGHLQIDATAIFLLLLAQMSASGLAIVQNPADVAFVQNLVHYLARAYRTPDYGIWERGHKRNEGRAEINASSVGMAKAALEAISGFDLLPGWAPRIVVQADDIAHARTTLAGLLPRESESKETDAALLSIIGYPAFAVDDPALVEATRERIVTKLQGRYGCKRFLRDGHQTVVEDHSRLHYEPGELQRFRRIESEWPLFFCYLLIDAHLRGDTASAHDYRQRIEALMVERDGQRLLPELYIVPAEHVDAERENPRSQDRVPNDNVPLVWAQSLYLVGALLHDGLVRPEQLDPLGRHKRSAPAPVIVQVALLAADELVRARLASHGIEAQTPEQVLPTRVRFADELDAALTRLGEHQALGLSGRPRQRPGSLATSLVYRASAEADAPTTVFLPAVFNRQGFYLRLDNRLLLDEIRAEVAHLRCHWQQGDHPPLLALRISEDMLDDRGADGLLAYLRQLSAASDTARGEGDAPATVVRGPLQALLPHAAVCVLPTLSTLADDVPPSPEQTAAAAAVLHWEEAATRVLSPARAAALERNHDDLALLRVLEKSRNPYEQIEVLGLLVHRWGLDAGTPLGGSLRELAAAVYARASNKRRWGVMRRAAGVLEVHDETLEEAVAQIVLRQKQVSLGRAYNAQAIIATPLGNAELFERLRRYGGDDRRGRVLIEEIVLLLGTLIKADATPFLGTLTLRPWYLLLLITGQLALEHGLSQAEAFDHLLDCSPQALLARLREVISRERDMSRDLVRLQSLHVHGDPSADSLVSVEFSRGSDPQLPEDMAGWLAWREMSGVLTRVPGDFHERIWALLRQVPGIVIGDQLDARNRLDSTLARADSTPGERSFALQVEDLLNKIHAPEYRQLTIETLLAISDICRANTELQLHSWLVLDVVIGIAVRIGWEQGLTPEAVASSDYNEHRAQAWKDIYTQPPHRVANLVMAALSYLVDQAKREQLEARAAAAAAEAWGDGHDGDDSGGGSHPIGGGAGQEGEASAPGVPPLAPDATDTPPASPGDALPASTDDAPPAPTSAA